MTTPTLSELDIEYPDSDGQPMSDNTLQFRWIVTVQGNLDVMYRDNPNVFVAGDLLWYPVQGHSEIRAAPDALVAFDRPRGDRGSYRQWEEGGVAPQVVWEILSPGNTAAEMERKFQFYDRYGVEEYYLYDPDGNRLWGWVRREGRLQPVEAMHGHLSPRLGIRFDTSGEELVLYRPDGRRFLTFVELAALEEKERQARTEAERQAEQDRIAKVKAEELAGQERLAKQQAEELAGQERLAKQKAEQKAEQERLAKEDAQARAERLAEKLRALGIDPNT